MADLTLCAALAANRLEDFVRQEQAHGVELGSGSEFERALALFLVQRGLRQDPLPEPGSGVNETVKGENNEEPDRPTKTR
jgi:hypothetical protein